MSLNLTLALIAGSFWFAAFFWYFRGSERILADFKTIAARLGRRRKPAPEDGEARQ